jgi:hypothetical protein
MSFNSRLFINESLRREIEPDNVVMRGNYKRHKPVEKISVTAMPDEYNLTGEELIAWQRRDEATQDEFLKSKGI